MDQKLGQKNSTIVYIMQVSQSNIECDMFVYELKEK